MYGKQVDDNVQSSTMGAVKPTPEHPQGDRLIPVSAATPDAEPKAERKAPPQKTGHDIAPTTPEGVKLDGPYAELPISKDGVADTEVDQAVLDRNAKGAAEKDSKAISTTDAPVDKSVETRDTPFPRATSAQPVQSVTGPKNAAPEVK